jgi:hypothetical protein
MCCRAVAPLSGARTDKIAFYIRRAAEHQPPGAGAGVGPRLRTGQFRPHIGVMHLDLSDEEAAALSPQR